MCLSLSVCVSVSVCLFLLVSFCLSVCLSLSVSFCLSPMSCPLILHLHPRLSFKQSSISFPLPVPDPDIHPYPPIPAHPVNPLPSYLSSFSLPIASWPVSPSDRPAVRLFFLLYTSVLYFRPFRCLPSSAGLSLLPVSNASASLFFRVRFGFLYRFHPSTGLSTTLQSSPIRRCSPSSSFPPLPLLLFLHLKFDSVLFVHMSQYFFSVLVGTPICMFICVWLIMSILFLSPLIIFIIILLPYILLFQCRCYLLVPVPFCLQVCS